MFVPETLDTVRLNQRYKLGFFLLMVAPVVFIRIQGSVAFVASSWKASCGERRDCFTRYTNPQLDAKRGQILCMHDKWRSSKAKTCQNLLLKVDPLSTTRNNELIVQVEEFETYKPKLIVRTYLACERRRISGCRLCFGGTSDSRKYVCVSQASTYLAAF